jgi:hypothetical protein
LFLLLVFVGWFICFCCWFLLVGSFVSVGFVSWFVSAVGFCWLMDPFAYLSNPKEMVLPFWFHFGSVDAE